MEACPHTHEDHAALKQSPTWESLPFAYHWTDELTGERFESRHCGEGRASTLSRAVER